MDGYDLCKAIRPQNQHVPVLMLTSMSALNDKMEGYESGADDYMVKPFEFKELLLKIRSLLKRTMNRSVPVGKLLKAVDQEMNLDNKEVKRNEGEVSTLQLKSFSFLNIFCAIKTGLFRE